MKMTWHIFGLLLALLPLSLASVCPESCVCSTTRDSLHRATCSNLPDLYKFTLRQKHHNINILDLSHNNITKLSHELDRLTEVVTLDLSTNGITHINKFLRNAKKLVHLNLANNRIEKISLAYLPKSISSLDLTNNLLKDLPSDIENLSGLEHLELEGNPLDCTCENILARDRLLVANVFIDNVKCVSPTNLRNRSWLELKFQDICKVQKTENNFMDMMMGDQPIDAIRVGEETTALKSMPLVAQSDLEDGSVLQSTRPVEEDDKMVYLRYDKTTSSSSLINENEGSGQEESSTDSDVLIYPKVAVGTNADLKVDDAYLPIEAETATIDPIEGSGEGSGYGLHSFIEPEIVVETTTPFLEELNPPPVHPIFEDDDYTPEYPIPKSPTIYPGGPNWHSEIETTTTEKPIIPITPDTTVSEQIRVTQASEILGSTEEKSSPHKTGTYICIAIIVVLLVGLVGFAIAKSQMRKRRDQRIIRQQKRDVETASKEMVDMNKSLLGKPAVMDAPLEKKLNGKYELVPTHESLQKNGENGGLANGLKNNDNKKDVRTDSPRDSNQNKSSSKDNNLSDVPKTLHDTSFESNDSRKDNSSLASVDIFVPMADEDIPRLNGNLNSETSQPLLNGDHVDNDYLSPREYIPVYSPDMGRVRIKLTEVPKPKTPILVTRSRSNAGDIVITPTVDINSRKSTT